MGRGMNVTNDFANSVEVSIIAGSPMLVMPIGSPSTLPREKNPMPGTRQYLVTSGVGITKSRLESFSTVFWRWHAHVDLANMTKVVLAADPDGTAPLIVDNDILVNGNPYIDMFSGTFTDPMQHQGESVTVAYQARDALDITGDMRRDSEVYIELQDRGYTFGASRLYIVIFHN
jgi:hypothetical protein